jgi:PGAP1-like protein
MVDPMAVVVVVHGIGKQVEGIETLNFAQPLRSGVMLAGAEPPGDADIHVAFYGDLFRKRFGKAGREPSYTAIDVEADERVLLELLWEGATADGEVPQTREDPTKARSPASVQRMLSALTRVPCFAGISEKAMIGDLKQVARYFREPETRAAVRDRLASAISTDTKVVVGHSLGSVVAYEVLAAQDERHQSVRALVTLGSPLGIRRVVFDRLAPTPVDGRGARPGRVTWTNVADPGDIVALAKALNPLFDGDIVDILVHNGAKAHDASPYLTARETGRAIAAGLAG